MLLFYCTNFGEVAIPVLFIDPIICPDWEVSQWRTGVAVEQRGAFWVSGSRSGPESCRIWSENPEPDEFSLHPHSLLCQIYIQYVDSVPNGWRFPSLCEIWGFKGCDVWRLTHRRPVSISVAPTRMVTSPHLASCHRIPCYWLFIDWEQVNINFAVHTIHHQMH
jgi:hypothetical protein